MHGDHYFKESLEKLKDMVDAETIIGKPIETGDGTVILPICKVTFGYTSGEIGNKTTHTGGFIGSGATIRPVSILVIGKMGVQNISLESTNNSFERMLELAPQFMDKLQSVANYLKQD